MLIAIDTVMYYIRLTTFFAAIFLFLILVTDLRATVSENAVQRAAVQLADNYLSSNLTFAHGVFDASALAALNENPIEAARLCSNPVTLEFFAYKDGGASQRISKIGYPEPGVSADYPVWLKFGEQLVPSIMKLSVEAARLTQYEDGTRVEYTIVFPALSCAVERAWVYKLPQEEVLFDCPYDACIIYTDGQRFCMAEIYRDQNALCRSMPGVNVTEYMAREGKQTLRAVPIKKGGVAECGNDQDIATGWADDVGTVILCEVQD